MGTKNGEIIAGEHDPGDAWPSSIRGVGSRRRRRAAAFPANQSDFQIKKAVIISLVFVLLDIG